MVEQLSCARNGSFRRKPDVIRSVPVAGRSCSVTTSCCRSAQQMGLGVQLPWNDSLPERRCG